MRSDASAERRLLTVLFCDLVGSTAISASLDAEDWRNLVSAYLDAASEAVTQMGGRVAKKLGDGLMALFGHPIAQENDSERAVRAALAIQRFAAVFPPTIVQTCIVHLIRNSMDFASWKDRKPIAAELKAIYRATDADVARGALEAFDAGVWGRKYPANRAELAAKLGVRHPVLRLSHRCAAHHVHDG
jgi:Transposase, Mutator family/Adenylate and Guanylate cyclase catalytic domain